ncbi:GNAT family N-acetyltransferase [Amycolatopsis sp. NPDC004772]
MTEPHVQPARPADVSSFAAALGDPGFFDDRMTRHLQRKGVLFLAWLDNRPAGAVYLWLEDAEELPLRMHLPGVPLLTHLEVHPDLRNLGIGAALVGAVEHHLAQHDRDRVALAVRTDNVAAARLYDRLAYRDWGHGNIVCYAQRRLPSGGILVEPEHCYVLVKQLLPVKPAPRSEALPIGASLS